MEITPEELARMLSEHAAKEVAAVKKQYNKAKAQSKSLTLTTGSPRKAKPKPKAKKRSKYCADAKTYKVNSVKLTEIEYRCWLGVKSLLEGYEMFLHSAGVDVPVLVTRPQITAREVVGGFGGDVLDKGLVAVANKALNLFEKEGIIVLRRRDVVMNGKTLTNLRSDVSIGPAGA
jgi:hypothetical protein